MGNARNFREARHDDSLVSSIFTGDPFFVMKERWNLVGEAENHAIFGDPEMPLVLVDGEAQDVNVDVLYAIGERRNKAAVRQLRLEGEGRERHRQPIQASCQFLILGGRSLLAPGGWRLGLLLASWLLARCRFGRHCCLVLGFGGFFFVVGGAFVFFVVFFVGAVVFFLGGAIVFVRLFDVEVAVFAGD